MLGRKSTGLRLKVIRTLIEEEPEVETEAQAMLPLLAVLKDLRGHRERRQKRGLQAKQQVQAQAVTSLKQEQAQHERRLLNLEEERQSAKDEFIGAALHGKQIEDLRRVYANIDRRKLSSAAQVGQMEQGVRDAQTAVDEAQEKLKQATRQLDKTKEAIQWCQEN